jgi:hypothetical protein
MFEFTISVTTGKNGETTHKLLNNPIETDATGLDFDYIHRANGAINEAYIIAPSYLNAICYLGSFMQVTSITMKEAIFVK